jgi:hypothetical protein
VPQNCSFRPHGILSVYFIFRPFFLLKKKKWVFFYKVDIEVHVKLYISQRKKEKEKA